MINVIIDFINLLREAGLRISPAETEDCFRALKLVDFEKDNVKEVMRLTLVKDSIDLEIFDNLFDLYFLNKNISKDNGDVNYNITSTFEKACYNDGRGLVKSGAGGPAPNLYDALKTLNNCEKNLEYIAQAAVEKISDDFKLEDIEKIDEKIRQIQVELEWYMAHYKIEKELSDGIIDLKTYHQRRKLLKNILKKIKVELQSSFVSKYGDVALKKIAASKNIREKDFAKLNIDEITQLKRKITQLGKSLARKKSFKFKKANSGQLNIKRIVKKSVKYNGIPLELPYKKKKLSRPELILLCDISRSVEQFSSFMLQLVYVAQNLFKDIHSFVFVDHISDVSSLFKKFDIDDALQEIKYLNGVSETGYSHFGQTFKEFYSEYISLVTDISTIIILGDAKNNWRPSGQEYLEQISRRCDKIFWLNPQPKKQWYQKDNIMYIYEPLCTEVYECRNLKQLEVVINQIIN